MIEFLKNISIRKFWLLKLWYDKKNTYLFDSGWINSFNEDKPLDKDGNTIPWISLPLFDFIKERIAKDFDIFEFGAGNSTLYFSPKINSIDSVEHDKDWAEFLQTKNLKNWTLYIKDINNGNEYEKAIELSNKKYDIIIVDGRKRVACTKESIHHLKENGVVILDDSHRERYAEALSFMKENGFKKLDFWGIGPGIIHTKNSTLFYKSNNCLGI